jgi:hypothetical protein
VLWPILPRVDFSSDLGTLWGEPMGGGRIRTLLRQRFPHRIPGLGNDEGGYGG